MKVIFQASVQILKQVCHSISFIINENIASTLFIPQTRGKGKMKLSGTWEIHTSFFLWPWVLQTYWFRKVAQ